MRYTPQLIVAKDSLGNRREVAVTYDRETCTYVGCIHSQVSWKRGEIVALGTGRTVKDAISATIQDMEVKA